MGTNVTALRAISAVFFRRILRWVIIIAGVLFAIALLLDAYLATTISPWWWLFLIVLIPAGVVGMLVATGLWVVSSRLLPRKMTKAENRQVLAFTDKIFGIAENARMPYPLLLILVGKDIIRGKQSSFIANTIQDTRSLQSDYEEIRQRL